MRASKFRRILMFVFFGVGAVVIFTFIVMWLWNAILPQVLGVSSISFIQALGILVLSKILFGFGGGHGGGGWNRKHSWKTKMKEKWTTMTPEEKEKFRQEWKNRCGPWKGFTDELESQPPIKPEQL